MNLGKESELLEFKETTKELGDAVVDIAAMLNKHGRGVLYFGVKNNGEVKGFQIGESTQRDISRKISERIKPQIFPTIEEVPNLKIIRVTFEGSDKPYSADGRYYLRVSDEHREMSPSELTRMILEVKRKDWERQQSASTVNDVDEKSLKLFLDRVIQNHRLPRMKFDKINLLQKLKLLCDDGVHLNNAGRVLFSSDEPVELKMAVFATDEKRTFIDISPIKGNVFTLIEEAEKYVKKNMRWKAVVNGFDRTDIPEIPVEALREIIVNSFAHADYVGWSKNELDIFPGRIAVYNPGTFPDDLSPEDFVNRTIASKLRNELICDILYKCKFVESWGTGIAKTYSLCSGAGIRCSYQKEGDGFWFIFHRPTTEEAIAVPPPVTPLHIPEEIVHLSIELTDLEKEVLEEIERDSAITKIRIAEKIGKSDRTVQRCLVSLQTKGFLKRIDGTRGHWEVTLSSTIDH